MSAKNRRLVENGVGGSKLESVMRQAYSFNLHLPDNLSISEGLDLLAQKPSADIRHDCTAAFSLPPCPIPPIALVLMTKIKPDTLPPIPGYVFPHQHLLGIADLSPHDIEHLAGPGRHCRCGFACG